MRLGELIAALEAADPDLVLPIGCAAPHSYRGIYAAVGFEERRDITVGAMLAAARSAVGSTYQGWKGGYFTMDASTEVHLVPAEGQCGEPLGARLLAYMLRDARRPPPGRPACIDCNKRIGPRADHVTWREGGVWVCRCKRCDDRLTRARIHASAAVTELGQTWER